MSLSCMIAQGQRIRIFEDELGYQLLNLNLIYWHIIHAQRPAYQCTSSEPRDAHKEKHL